MVGIAGGALALALAGGAVYAGPSLRAAAQAAPIATAQPNDPAAPGARQPRKAALLTLALIKATADTTGTAPKDVAAAVKGGQSLAQYAQAHGKTADDVVAAARAKLSERFKQAVASGKLTQARADDMLKQFDAAAPQVVADTQLGAKLADARQARQGRRGMVGRAALIKATADVTGTAPKDVRAALQGGQSLAQYAQAHGKTADDIIAKLRESGETRLAKLLDKAKGLLDQPGLGRGGQQPVQ
jgi:hypothetical protein